MKKMVDIFAEIFNFIRWGWHFVQRPWNKTFSHYKEKVVVVGNGPSAGTFLYDKYKKSGYEFCCVNFFANNQELFNELRPKYYCCIDPFFFKDNDDVRIFIKAMESVDWELHIITFSKYQLAINNKNIVYDYINENAYEGEYNYLKNLLFKYNLASINYRNVIIAALYYFIMSSTEMVILTGVENDWHRELFVLDNNDVIREDTHFYGTRRLNITKKGEIAKGKLYMYFYYYYMTLFQYSIIADFAKSMNVKVINTCVNSFIDVFEKKEAKDIVSFRPEEE